MSPLEAYLTIGLLLGGIGAFVYGVYLLVQIIRAAGVNEASDAKAEPEKEGGITIPLILVGVLFTAGSASFILAVANILFWLQG